MSIPNNKYGITPRSYQELISAISKFPEIKKVKIFGSRVMGNYKKGSDIDIAIYGNIDLRLIFRLEEYLEEFTQMLGQKIRQENADVKADLILTKQRLNEKG